MNRSDYFQKISELYELSDKLKIVNTSQKIDLFILNLSPLLRFALFIYFLIMINFLIHKQLLLDDKIDYGSFDI